MGQALLGGRHRTAGLGLTRLVLLPGLLCDESIWRRQAETLYDVPEIEIPLYRSATRLEDMARIALDWADGPIAVAGLSMGARVALEMWRAAPERIERLALFDFWVGPVVEGEPARRKVLTDLAETDGMQSVAETWVASMVAPDRIDDAELIEPLHAMVCTYTPEQFKGQIEALLNRVDLWPLLPTITVPTLIAVGRQDPWRSVDQHREMAEVIPGARLEVIEECGHLSPAEQPDAVSRLLRDWLTWDK